MIKVAIVVADNRDEIKQYDLPNPSYGSAPDTLLDGFAQLAAECEVHVISCSRQPMKTPERLAANIFLHTLHVPRLGRFRTFYVGMVQAVRAAVRRIQPDIVHGQGSERYAALAAAWTGFPNLITLHGLMTAVVRVEKFPFFSYLGITALMERMALRKTRGVICLTKHAQELASEFTERTWVIPNAVADRYFAVKREPAAPAEILHVAHIYHLKNQHGLIRALDPLVGKLDFTLRLFGKPTGDDGSRQTLDLASTRPWCKIMGMASEEQIRAALSTATALALPSFEENCPMSILEAMAAGLPVVASRAGGIPDLVQDGVTGFLFDPRDGNSIRGAVEKILANPDRAQRMGVAGKARAEKEFRPRIIAKRHLEIYREVLGRR